MTDQRYQVAKAIITIEGDHYLLSIKRNPGSDNDGKLEFLGGRFEPGETPRDALLRELSEEESTGELARIAQMRATFFFSLVAGGAEHFLFPIHLSRSEFELLEHHPDESFGFELRSREDLEIDPDQFTSKTNKILETLA